MGGCVSHLQTLSLGLHSPSPSSTAMRPSCSSVSAPVARLRSNLQQRSVSRHAERPNTIQLAQCQHSRGAIRRRTERKGLRAVPWRMRAGAVLFPCLRVLPPALRAVQLHAESCDEHPCKLNSRHFITKDKDASEDRQQLLDR